MPLRPARATRPAGEGGQMGTKAKNPRAQHESYVPSPKGGATLWPHLTEQCPT